MPLIHSVSTAFPYHRYTQREVIEKYLSLNLSGGLDPNLISKFFTNSRVESRYFSLPLDEYPTLTNFRRKNEIYLEVSKNILQRAVGKLIEDTGVDLSSVGLFASSTVTGIAVPSLEARLMNIFPFSKTTKRMPLFGLGCLAGVAGINRVADYLRGHPKEAAIFVSVELCSLTWRMHDFEPAHLISASLFGDGCAAVLVCGDEHPLASSAKFNIKDSISWFIPDSERVMGFDVAEDGLKVVLSAEVPEIVVKHIPLAVKALMHPHANIEPEFFVAHPGGPKVLLALGEVLGVAPEKLGHSWNCLRDLGNLSSVSVLCTLQKFFSDPLPRGSFGLMSAMGPAFCAELALLETMN